MGGSGGRLSFHLLGTLGVPAVVMKSIYLFTYLFIFREGKGGREGEKHQHAVASRTLPTGDLAHNPSMCPDWESNQQHFGSEASTQSTEPQQPGLVMQSLIRP